MSLEYINEHYGVTAYKGQRVIYTGDGNPTSGVIIGARGSYLKIKMDDGMTGFYHPTWELSLLS